MRLPLLVSVRIYDHLQRAREQYFVQLLSWIPLMYVRCATIKLYSTFTVKVKVTLVQALRLCTGRTAQRGSRGIALLFHDHGTRRG